MSDLVERLRNNQQHAPMINHAGEIYGLEKSLDALAADEIERLTQQRDELLAALKTLVAEAKPETSKTELRQNLAEDCTDLLLIETFSDAVINARAAIAKAES